MQKTKSLKVTGITLSGFRCHKDKITVALGDTTLISGDNGKGKSSIAHAIAYALYGTDAFGAQDIDRILNNESDTVSVSLTFTDDTGAAHELMRSRTGDKTNLQLDGYTIRQAGIETLFGSKDTFLSLFNPSYFAEIMGGKAREFIEMQLPIIKPPTVLAQMTKHEQGFLQNADLAVPEITIQKCRAEIGQSDENHAFIGGQIAELQKAAQEKDSRIAALKAEAKKLNEAVMSLKSKQFDGVNVDDLAMEKCMLEDKLTRSDSAGSTNQLTMLKAALFEAESKDYHSKYAEHIAKQEALLKAMGLNYEDLRSRLQSVQAGAQCTFCLTEITAGNVAHIRNMVQERIRAVYDEGQAERAKLNELLALDKSAQEKFDEFVQADIAKIKQQIAEMSETGQTPDNKAELYRRVREIDTLLKRGNLSETEHSELVRSESRIDRLVSDYNVLQNADYADRITQLQSAAEALAVSSRNAGETIRALQQYTAKRSELALAGLKIPNVTIKLYEIVKSTGELKPCFKFLYCRREYPALSLSEKIKAGIEIVYMLRDLTECDYPIFIDNSESIGDFNSGLLPSQSLFMRFKKDTELAVKTLETLKTQTPKITQISAQEAA
jgi:DNA repair exonuclease SbcCD ATPase subunit